MIEWILAVSALEWILVGWTWAILLNCILYFKGWFPYRRYTK